MYNCVGYFCTYPCGLSLNVWDALVCIASNRHGVTIMTHAIKRHFLIWMTTVRQPTKRRRSCVLTLKYTFICVYTFCVDSYSLVHPGVRDKRRVSEIDFSQPRHETAFWWRHNGPVTSQLIDLVKWPNYPLELIGIYVHTNTHNKESLTQRCRRSTNVQMCLIFLYICIWFESNWMACLIAHHK